MQFVFGLLATVKSEDGPNFLLKFPFLFLDKMDILHTDNTDNGPDLNTEQDLESHQVENKDLENYIIKGLSSSNSSLNSIVNDVVDSFTDKQDALKDLVTVILQTAGCYATLGDDAFEDPDLIPDELRIVEQQFKTQKSQKIKHFNEFWVKLVQKMKTNYLFDQDDDTLDQIIQWIASISSSGVRQLRHTATLAGLSIVTGLAILLNNAGDEIAKLQKQKNKEVSNRISQINEEKTSLEAYISKLFNGYICFT